MTDGRILRTGTIAILCFVAGCGVPGDLLGVGTASGAGGTHQVLCTAPAPPREPWRNPLTPLLRALGGPVHGARDVVVSNGEAITLRGRFGYGPTSKDLQEEAVVAYVAPRDGECTWIEAGRAVTGSDGRVELALEPGLLEGPGQYAYWLAVPGDGSGAGGYVHVLDPGTPVVVFDIDGTLTTDDLELVDGAILHTVRSTSEVWFTLAGLPLSKDLWLLGLERLLREDAQMHEGAVDVARHWVSRGYQPVYLTGRPYLFEDITREWLDRHGFPAGPVRLTDHVEDSLPAHVSDYKLRFLTDLEGRVGVDVSLAYGNSTNDICAYARAGVDPERTFIVGEHAGEACDGRRPPRPLGDYRSHLDSAPE